MTPGSFPSTRARPGIQANDLIGRKLVREKVPGATANAWMEEGSTLATALAADAELGDIGKALRGAAGAWQEATAWLLSSYDSLPRAAAVGAVAT